MAQPDGLVQQIVNLTRRARAVTRARKFSLKASAAYSQADAQALADQLERLTDKINELLESFGTGNGR